MQACIESRRYTAWNCVGKIRFSEQLFRPAFWYQSGSKFVKDKRRSPLTSISSLLRCYVRMCETLLKPVSTRLDVGNATKNNLTFSQRVGNFPTSSLDAQSTCNPFSYLSFRDSLLCNSIMLSWMVSSTSIGEVWNGCKTHAGTFIWRTSWNLTFISSPRFSKWSRKTLKSPSLRLLLICPKVAAPGVSYRSKANQAF